MVCRGRYGEYAIWDNQTDDYYVDPEGVTEYFTDEWLANDYLEEVRQSVAAMESVQPETPATEPDEVVEAPVSEEPTWNYQVGDTVYLDDTAFRVEQITDREVQLRDPTLAYPIFRAENRENFERMLSQDERNHAVRVDAQTEEKPVTEEFLGEAEPRNYTPEYQLLDRLRMDCEYFLGAGQHSEKHLWAGNRHAQIAKMRELYEMIPDKPEWLTPEMINSYEERMAPRYLVAAYHHFENGFDDKLDYYTLEEAEKAAQGYVDGTMEDDGFKYDGAAVYDQQEHKCIRIYGDYPDEKAHAQVRASAEPEQQEPEHFIDHFYVAEDIQKRGALDIKEYSSFDDALRAYYVLPDTQRKALGAMNTRDLPGSLDFVQCVAGKDTIIQDYAKMDGWQNLPELMNMFKEVADIKTSDQLHLPVPEAKFETVVVQPSEYQKDMVASLSERAADVHAGIVDPSVDNMLKITSDGRKLGLDQRLMNPLLPDDPDSKLNACVGNILRIWQDGQADKLTQLVFCDLSTPKNDGTFNVYDDVKTKLIANGVPAEEIAFIHDADTEAKKKDLFAKVRTGQVRVLLGSTQKMGAGTNVQDKLVAVHHLDVGWRPSDMTQRNGRIIRQGNRNKEVQVYQYVTEGTFDAYLYQTLENKQKFISQIMTSKSPVRSCDDVDEQALSYAEIKALCAGNPLIKEKMDLDIDVARLKVLKADHQSQQYRMEDKLLKYFPAEIEKQTGYIHGFEADMKTVEAHPQIADGFCGMEIMGKAYTEKADAGEILLAACKDTKSADPVPLGSYRGFQMELSFDSFRNEFDVTLKGAVSHRVALGTDARGNITRLDNALAGIPERLERANEQLNNLYNQQEAAKAEVGKPFPQEAELTAKSQRLAELDAALNMEDSAENRDERSESERPSVLADLKSKAEHIPPAKYSEPREEVL